jgi:hypothetical protein
VKRLVLFVVVASLLLIPAAAVQAGRIVVEFEPPQVAVGENFRVEICGTGGRLVDYRVTRPDGSSFQGQFFANDRCTNDYYVSVPATLAGTYTFEVLSGGGKVQAAGSGTAI